jgi:hypothetical protein
LTAIKKNTYSLLILLALFVWAIQLSGYIGRMYISDDLLWYFFTGEELAFPTPANDLKTELASALVRVGADQGYIVRYDLLNRYSTNYPFVSASYAAVGSIIRVSLGAFRFDEYLIATLIVTNIIFGAVAIVIVGLAAFTSRNSALTVGFVLAVAIETLVLPYSAAAFAPFYEASFLSGAAQALHHLLVPGPEFTMLNTGPRNLLAGLTLAVFLLRWSKRLTESYWLLFCLVFVHQSTTLLVICTVVGIDLVLRPRVISRSYIPIVAAILFGVVREKVWHLTGFSISTALGSVGLVFAALAVAYVVRRGHLRLPAIAVMWRDAIANRPPQIVEPIAFLAIWMITLPLPYFVNKFVDPYQSYYFWSVLHTRSLGVMHPSLLMGLTAAAFVSLQSWRRLRAAIVAGLIGGACIQATTREALFLRSPYARMHIQLEQLQEKLANLSSIGAQDLTDGSLVYFGMSKAAEGADDRFKRLLVAAPNSIN